MDPRMRRAMNVAYQRRYENSNAGPGSYQLAGGCAHRIMTVEVARWGCCMSLAIRKSEGPTVEAVVSGKLTQRDYQALVVEIESRLRNRQTVRMLMELQDF